MAVSEDAMGGLPNKRRQDMAIIGTFKATENGYTGSIYTLTLKEQVNFEAVDRKSSEKAPDYRIFARGAGYEIGAAWLSTSPETGAQSLSVKIDDPSFAAPINCRLVKTGAEQGHSLLWDRNRKR
jgi:uncharacterized protein (DUF736 family)